MKKCQENTVAKCRIPCGFLKKKHNIRECHNDIGEYGTLLDFEGNGKLTDNVHIVHTMKDVTSSLSLKCMDYEDDCDFCKIEGDMSVPAVNEEWVRSTLDKMDVYVKDVHTHDNVRHIHIDHDIESDSVSSFMGGLLDILNRSWDKKQML